MRSALLPLLLVFCEIARSATLIVGTATAASGQKASGAIQVPAGVDAAVSIPVMVVNGARPGPTLALVAGSHGTEYASIIALEKLAQSADAQTLSGALIIVPLVNPGSFEEKVAHVNPVDRKNMNRFYPGKADGSQTERASWAITKQVIEKCDYLIDLHGGDLDENMRQYSYWAQTGRDSQDAISRGMVLAFGLDHIIIQDFRSAAASGATTIARYASSIGKPSVTAEAGHAGTTNPEDVEALVEGCTNVMRHLKILPGKAAVVEHPLWIGNISVVASERDGTFYPLAVPEAYVTKGQKIGYVTDHFGNKLWDAAAPVSGVIVYICSVPSMKKGNTIAYVGELRPGE